MTDYGKLPPQVRELEEAVIGAILIERDAMDEVINVLTPDCFYMEAHQRIFSACRALYERHSPIDLLTVTEQLKRTNELDAVGGSHFISVLTNKVGSSAHIDYHATVIKEKYIQRKMIAVCSTCIKNAYEESVDVFDTYDKLLSELNSINGEVNIGNITPFGEIVRERSKALKAAGENKTYITGLKTCLGDLDRITLGWQPTDLIIIAGRPAMGKTALAIDIARKQVRELNAPIGVFSLEMSKEQLVDRMFSAESGIDFSQIRKGGMRREQWETFDETVEHMQHYNLHICDKGGLSINELCSISKNWKLRHGIQAIYVDYLQLVTAEKTGDRSRNREQEISSITRRLKALAKDLHIPVIALSQLSRQVEQRTDKRPMLSDLRESGAIEQDADMVIFPYRDEYYNQNAEKGICELIIAKYRNGDTGKITVYFDAERQTFKNYSATPFG